MYSALSRVSDSSRIFVFTDCTGNKFDNIVYPEVSHFVLSLDEKYKLQTNTQTFLSTDKVQDSSPPNPNKQFKNATPKKRKSDVNSSQTTLPKKYRLSLQSLEADESETEFIEHSDLEYEEENIAESQTLHRSDDSDYSQSEEVCDRSDDSEEEFFHTQKGV